MVSQRVRYSLNALVQMVAFHGVRQVKTVEFARWAGAPPRNLENALLDLKRHGLISSIRGANGGYVFARNPAQITFADVFRALDGPIALAPCAGELNEVPCQGCVSTATCNFHPSLVEARKALVGVLETWTLAAAFESDRSPLA